MIQTIVVAVSENNAIGVHNDLPWRLPDDLRFFKKVTLGKPVLMGRKTYESLGRPLPGRLNVVLSRSQLQLPEEVLQFTSLPQALRYLEDQGLAEVCIIGGGQIFEQALPDAHQLFLTRVHTIIGDADVFFPEIDPLHWTLIWEEAHPADERHAFSFTFMQYQKSRIS